MKKIYIFAFVFLAGQVFGQRKHGRVSLYPSYKGLIMAGYQGWFRGPDDGSGDGWGHYALFGKVDRDHIHTDLWPDVSEYAKTYATDIKNSDGSNARLFSSWDESTTDLHFKWMKEYGLDGVFMQRFFSAVRTEKGRTKANHVLINALKASRKYSRAISVMYDLSGIKPGGEDCSAIMEDWKQLVDSLRITSRGDNQTYLYHNGKPLVAIWGLGFPDRSYKLIEIGIEKLIDFFKNDPHYGGCSIMLGVPTYFRELSVDCLPDPYLQKIIRQADIVLPWMVQRFTPLLQAENERYELHVRKDLAWCRLNHVDYAPCVYPGFSWYNLGRAEFGGLPPLGQIPRQKGKFYWDQMYGDVKAGVQMIYVAMFDEMDEGTAIMKCSNNPPQGSFRLLDYEGMPTDHYLWLTGKAGEMLRGKLPLSATMPSRKD